MRRQTAFRKTLSTLSLAVLVVVSTGVAGASAIPFDFFSGADHFVLGSFSDPIFGTPGVTTGVSDPPGWALLVSGLVIFGAIGWYCRWRYPGMR
jgi:hypothetical protein